MVPNTPVGMDCGSASHQTTLTGLTPGKTLIIWKSAAFTTKHLAFDVDNYGSH